MTSYNLVDYIDTSIQSVVQMYMPFEWELLIGDDGSTDGTVNKIQEWVKRYPNNIKLFQLERDKCSLKIGSRAARNRAFLLTKASGDYLNYLDGDDCFLGVEKIKRQVEILEQEEYADCSCCAHNTQAYVVPENRKYLITSENIKGGKMTLKEYWKQYYFHTNTLMFRRKCIPLLLDSLYKDYLNDNFITYLVLQFGKVVYLEDVWCQYNMTGDGLWTGRSKLYGLFRNMQILDLQVKQSPWLERTIIYRHRYDIQKIRRTYNKNEYANISSLVEALDANVFVYTSLLSKFNIDTISEKIKKMRLYFKTDLCLLESFCKKIIRKVLGNNH